ncbi:MAG: hypothetical protein AABN95_13780 [Acidobacteriota bacterium]
MPDKVIVTNLTALKQKYGAAGLKKIQSALKDLIAADKKRGLTSTLVALDDGAAMKKLKAPPVKDADSTRENKKAIDGVYKALVPDYLMILGAIDVVPHQDLKNPLFSTDPDGDDERFADSDLPYACDAPYSQNIKDFTGPTRVVGRLPDLTGAQGSPEYLLGVLKTAAKWKSLERSDYEKYLGISADKWRESTSESLNNIFNSDKDLQNSPTKGFKWTPGLINRRVHFINCHGGDTLPDFFGQSDTDDDDMPVSHRAVFVGRKNSIVEGTIVAAECCYGAQLYDPSAEDDGQMGMCNTYLDKKAYGFFGSSNTAYGPSTGNDQADLVCQYFIQRVLAGASTGRAALEARLRFVEKASPLSPMNRKTLAQFNLFGDPAIVPVDKATSKLVGGPKLRNLTRGVKPLGAAKSASTAKAIQQAGAAQRAQRRDTLRAKGAMLLHLQPSMSKSKAGPPNKVEASLRKMMVQLNCKPGGAISFKVGPAPSPASATKGAMAKGITRTLAAKKHGTTAFHVMFGKPATVPTATRSTAKTKGIRGMAKGASAKAAADKDIGHKSRLRNYVVLEAKEVDGKIVEVTEAHSK